MLVHLLHDQNRIRFLFWPEYQRHFSYVYPDGCLKRPEAFPAIFHPVISRLNRTTLVQVTDRQQSLATLIQWISEVSPAKFEPLRSTPSKIEWSFQTPDRLSPTRELAMNGAAFLWPDRDLMLFQLGQELTLDILQHRVHLGGYPLFGVSQLCGEFFPNTRELLRFQPRKSMLSDAAYRQISQEVAITGLFSAWKAFVQRQYSPEEEPLMITYGDDAAGVHLFPTVADYHRPDLPDLGARELCFAQL